MRHRAVLLLAVALFTLALTPTGVRAQTLGDSRVVAPVPSPGFPEGIASRGNRFYVSGPAAFGQLLGSAFVQAYDIRTGALVTKYPVTVTNPFVGMSAASCIAFGPDGKLYVIEPFVGVIRMNLDPQNTQSVYAPFVPTGPSLLNDLAFDEDGTLYVTDSLQGAILRAPAGGGALEVWFADPRLAGDPTLPFGVNGLRIDKKTKRLYVSVTVESGSLEGVIYRLPLVASPTATNLEEFHRYPLVWPGPVLPAPDGIAFGKSGMLYVALAGTSQISVLGPDGTEKARYSGPADPDGVQLPWANPANIAFDDQSGALLVTNHASLVVPYNPALFAIFSVFVNDRAQPLP